MPHAAATGAMISEVLSPTPPVECLSAFGASMSEKSIIVPDCEHRLRDRVLLAPIHARRINIAITSAVIW